MTEIPRITDPMGRHWQQPPHHRVLVDDTHALLERRDFEQLLEYSGSIPDGKYVGKMWCCRIRETWLLCWYGKCDDPTMLAINRREILIADVAA